MLVESYKKEGILEIRGLILHLLGECARGPDRRLERIAAAFSPDTLFALGETGMLLYLRR